MKASTVWAHTSASNAAPQVASPESHCVLCGKPWLVTCLGVLQEACHEEQHQGHFQEACHQVHPSRPRSRGAGTICAMYGHADDHSFLLYLAAMPHKLPQWPQDSMTYDKDKKVCSHLVVLPQPHKSLPCYGHTRCNHRSLTVLPCYGHTSCNHRSLSVLPRYGHISCDQIPPIVLPCDGQTSCNHRSPVALPCYLTKTVETIYHTLFCHVMAIAVVTLYHQFSCHVVCFSAWPCMTTPVVTMQRSLAM